MGSVKTFLESAIFIRWNCRLWKNLTVGYQAFIRK